MHKLDDFHELYKEVTARLLQYIRDPSSGLQPHELDWFEQLVGDFIAQYEMWSPRHPQPTIEAYLLKFDKWLMPREIRLAGHAFLHIAYDLPRVMSAKLSASVKDRTRQGQIFVQAGPLFSKTFLDWIAAGKLGRIRKLFPQDAMRIMAFWVLALRTTAWVHAGVIEDFVISSPTQNLRDVEQRMAVALDDAAGKALGKTWILGIPELTNADLLQVAPIGVLSRLTTAAGLLASAALGAAAVILVGWRLRRRQQTVLIIEVLGALVNSGVQRALRGESDHNTNPERPVRARA